MTIPAPPPSRRRILFVAEAVTLAHVARPMTLARGLKDTHWQVEFACANAFHHLLDGEPWPLHNLDSIPPARFLASLAKGSPVYDLATLENYLEADLALLDRAQPDVVVGDFRLSLSVSARLRGIPYATITNAYWSPYARPRYEVPELPVTRLLGATIAGPVFRVIRPLAFALHSIPMNRLRRRHGLPTLGANLGRIYTDADWCLYADIPELIPTFDRPPSHHYLGPIHWSPPGDPPDWWTSLPDDRPIVYVTLGSSGDGRRLQSVLDGLTGLEVNTIVATAGRAPTLKVPDHTWVADFLPGDQACARASLVVCNGGSPTTHQALTAGIPVLGIAGNLDQYLNMSYLQQAGVGRLLRSGQADTKRVQDMAGDLLADPEARQRAQTMATRMQAYPAAQRFREWLRDIP